MKNTNIKYMIAAAAIAATCGNAFSQASYSGYFLDNYLHRYELNPAFADTTKNGFVAFPALGNMNIGMQGNIHVSSLVYNRNGRTVLFTNPEVTANEVLKNIHDKNKLGVNADLNILAVGFKALGGQNAVTIGVSADANAMLPGSLIKMAKEGVANKTYDIKDFRLNASGYAKIQFNHSRDIKQLPGLRVGAAFKVLLGMANLDAYLNSAELELGQDAWYARTNADVYANFGNMHYTLSRNDNTGAQYVDGIDLDGFGIKGFGIGFDLGASYKWRDFDFSLSLLDLGFISWSGTQYATTGGLKEVNTDKYIFGTEDGEADAAWHALRDDISELYQLEDRGDIGSRTRALRATLNWGVQYTLPYYRNLTFGLVNTTRFNGPFTATDFRFSANVTPVKILSASVNFAAGTYGVGFGWLLNLNLNKGFSLYLGMDRTIGKLAKQGVPLNSNAEVNLGINFPF